MKIGIVGGYGHESIKFLPKVKLAWACDDYDKQALVKAKAFGSEKTYSSMEVMLEDFQPDIVYIGSVYARNGCLAVRALELGFDVVSEKPLATDQKTLDRLYELTANGKRRTIAEFTMRWMEPFKKARQLIQSGVIGQPVMIQAQKTYKFGTRRPNFYKSRELFGGIIPWVAVHAIDYAAWCTGLQYESVTAAHGNRCFPDYPEMEDHAALLFQMTGKIPCLITADFLRPQGASSHSDDRLRVTGSEGVVEVRGGEVWLTNASKDRHWHCKSAETSRARRATALAKAALGAVDPGITTLECLHITAAALAARDAADSGSGNTLHKTLTVPIPTKRHPKNEAKHPPHHRRPISS